MLTGKDLQRLEKWLIILISAHSFMIGVFLLFFTRWGTALGGWPELVPLFFARQAGAFHLVVTCGYLLDYFKHGSVTFLLITKILAVTFLTGVMIHDPSSPWSVPVSAVGDGLMAMIVYLVHRKAAL